MGYANPVKLPALLYFAQFIFTSCTYMLLYLCNGKIHFFEQMWYIAKILSERTAKECKVFFSYKPDSFSHGKKAIIRRRSSSGVL